MALSYLMNPDGSFKLSAAGYIIPTEDGINPYVPPSTYDGGIANGQLTSINGPASVDALPANRNPNVTDPNQDPVPPGGNVNSHVGLDPDLMAILNQYLNSQGVTDAGIDKSKSNQAVNFDAIMSKLGIARHQGLQTKQANLADHGTNQSGIALQAINQLNQNFDNQASDNTNANNQALSGLEQQRLAAEADVNLKKAALYSQQTDRSAAAENARQVAAATAQAALPQVTSPAPVVAPDPTTDLTTPDPALTPADPAPAVRVSPIQQAAKKRITPKPAVVKPVKAAAPAPFVNYQVPI